METRSVENVEISTQKLLRDLKTVVRDGEELLKAGARDLSERGVAARKRLEAALEVARDTQHQLQESAFAQARQADRLIRGSPYEAVGIAFVIGLLIGAITGRR